MNPTRTAMNPVRSKADIEISNAFTSLLSCLHRTDRGWEIHDAELALIEPVSNRKLVADVLESRKKTLVAAGTS